MKKKEIQKQKEFMRFYEPIHENFVRYCKARSYSVIPYEDLINESIVRAYENWSSLKDHSSLKYYLFGIAKNIVLNLIRKKKESSLDNIGDPIDNGLNIEIELSIQFLYSQLEKLSDNKKEALILFEISGFSIKEIAKSQNSTEGAIKTLLSRARKELKELMLDEPKCTNRKEVEL